MATVASLQSLRNDLILKFSIGAAIFADIDAATIPDIFDTDGSILALPTGYKSAGLCNTDGIQTSRDISNEEVMAWQTAEVVRSDISADKFSVKTSFLETNPVTMALSENQKLADMPALGVPVKLDRSESGDQPLRRLLLLGQDTQNDIVFARFLPRVKVTNVEDQKMQRSDPSNYGYTISAYRDPEYGTSGRYFIGGPGWLALAG